MSTGGFGGRKLELEEEFFRKQDEQLLKSLRQQVETKEKRKALASALGISDEALVDRLQELDVSTETLAAISLIPLIAVAWADGSIDAKERGAVMAAAEQEGLEKGHPGYQLLQRWLEQKPRPRLLEVWKHYVSALGEGLGDAPRAALKQTVLGHARAVAEAAGGLLGLGSRISKAEQAVLDDLEKSL